MLRARSWSNVTRSWSIGHDGDIAGHAFGVPDHEVELTGRAFGVSDDEAEVASYAFVVPEREVEVADLALAVRDRALVVDGLGPVPSDVAVVWSSRPRAGRSHGSQPQRHRPSLAIHAVLFDTATVLARTRLLIIVTAALTALALSACGGGGSGMGGSGGTGHGGSTTTATTTSSTGGGSACGATVWSATNEPCNACMEQSCCAKLAACDTGTGCGSLIACLEACAPGDGPCAQGCQAAEPDGVAALQALFACYEMSCKSTTACGSAVCDSGFVHASAECGDCLSASCCDTWKACAADETCSDCLVMSAASCVDPTSESGKAFQAAMTCQKTQCGMHCAVGICDSGLGTSSSACNYCLGQSCCADIKACAAEPGCLDCLTSGGNSAGCADTGTSTGQMYEAVAGCWESNCASACGG